MDIEMYVEFCEDQSSMFLPIKFGWGGGRGRGGGEVPPQAWAAKGGKSLSDGGGAGGGGVRLPYQSHRPLITHLRNLRFVQLFIFWYTRTWTMTWTRKLDMDTVSANVPIYVYVYTCFQDFWQYTGNTPFSTSGRE